MWVCVCSFTTINSARSNNFDSSEMQNFYQSHTETHTHKFTCTVQIASRRHYNNGSASGTDLRGGHTTATPDYNVILFHSLVVLTEYVCVPPPVCVREVWYRIFPGFAWFRYCHWRRHTKPLTPLQKTEYWGVGEMEKDTFMNARGPHKFIANKIHLYCTLKINTG